MYLLISLLCAGVTGAGGMFYLKSCFKEKEVGYTDRQKKLYIVITAVFFAASAAVMGLLTSAESRTLIDHAKNLLLVYVLYFIAAIDFKTKLIPNKAVLALLAAAVVLNAVQAFTEPESVQYNLTEALLGCFIAGGIFLIGKLLSHNGMGMGDVKLMAVSGLMVGMNVIMAIVFWALFAAMITGIVLMAAKKAKAKSTMPLGPFFFAGSVICNIFFIING